MVDLEEAPFFLLYSLDGIIGQKLEANAIPVFVLVGYASDFALFKGAALNRDANTAKLCSNVFYYGRFPYAVFAGNKRCNEEAFFFACHIC